MSIYNFRQTRAITCSRIYLHFVSIFMHGCIQLVVYVTIHHVLSRSLLAQTVKHFYTRNRLNYSMHIYVTFLLLCHFVCIWHIFVQLNFPSNLSQNSTALFFLGLNFKGAGNFLNLCRKTTLYLNSIHKKLHFSTSLTPIF